MVQQSRRGTYKTNKLHDLQLVLLIYILQLEELILHFVHGIELSQLIPVDVRREPRRRMFLPLKILGIFLLVRDRCL